MYYPPRFDFRHFMAHLAPGGYTSLYFLVFTLLLFWCFFPNSIESIALSAFEANPIILSIGFIIFVVHGYFVGVVLRLPSVDKVDKISVHYRLRRELKKEWKKALRPKPRILWWLRPFGPDAINWDDVDVATLGLDTSIEAYANLPKKFHNVVRYLAAGNLILTPKRGMPSITSKAVAALHERPNQKFVMQWLWMTDTFPYPLWLTYKSILWSTSSQRKEFVDKLWEIVIATMCGKVAAGDNSKEPFNRCKLVVRRKSERLASAISEAEALTRMMVGFYFGLWFALRASVIGALILSLFLGCFVLFNFFSTKIVWALPHTPIYFGMVFLGLVISVVFNEIMLRLVVKNFRILRMSEAQMVFDSYCIVQSSE